MKPLALVCLSLTICGPISAGSRDGRVFDPGHLMTARAAGAPEELDRALGLLGHWDVEVIKPRADGEPLVSKGRAEITFMNRGHALKETFYSSDFEGHELASMSFLGFNPGSRLWFLGSADSWSERAWIADGTIQEDRWILFDTRRVNGGIARTEFRYTLDQRENDRLEMGIHTSSDGGSSWQLAETRSYRRRDEPTDEPSAGYGSPDPIRPAEAAAFDFLLGEWNNAHDLTFPNGQRAQWVSNATAVYALNGAAILEFSWFDVDPNLPDAATTILRIYNRAMRRWESLYAANRGHSILYFGGRQEGDEVVLGSFDADSAGASIPKYVFHSIEKDSYSWYSETSQDRGQTWKRTWLIEAKRKQAESAPAK